MSVVEDPHFQAILEAARAKIEKFQGREDELLAESAEAVTPTEFPTADNPVVRGVHDPSGWDPSPLHINVIQILLGSKPELRTLYEAKN